MADDNESSTRPTPFWPLLAALCGVFGLWLLSYFLISGRYSDYAERGQFGDMFGAVNALFSGLAFAGVLYAVYIQREDLRVARQETAMTKEILKDQQTQLARQNAAVNQQMFENTFFQVLRLFTEVAQAIELPVEPGVGTRVGHSALIGCWEFHKALFKQYRTFGSVRQKFQNRYGFRLRQYQQLAGQVLLLIDESDLQSKARYARLFRALLSPAEASLLMCAAIEDDTGVLRRLLEAHSMLGNAEDLEGETYHWVRAQFSSSAFKATA